MKLYLMRHGQAASKQEDPQEGLTVTGRTDIQALALQLANKNIQFGQIFHSTKTRARQTAEIIAQVLAPTIAIQEKTGLKPNDDPRLLIPEISSWQDDTLLTSHLPFVPTLLALLVGETSGISFVPGTIVCLSKNAHTWKLEWSRSP